jgi:hypothetical protein
MTDRTYNVDIPGYTVTSTEDPTFKTEVRGLVYHNMGYAQMQMIQGMFLDFAARLKAVGDSMMTPEETAKHDAALFAGTGRKQK